MRSTAALVCAATLAAASLTSSGVQAAEQHLEPSSQHQHAQPPGGPAAWHVMQDGVAFLTYNKQGGPRGGQDDGELVSQNWWMAMAQRRAGGGTLQLNLMVSLEPLTNGKDGYRQIFQAGETLNGFPLIDRQHPHDTLMQAAVVWRVPLGRGYSLALAGAPVGEAALGPVAFMHRSSSFENPIAPLGHHSFDSTHITHGVVAAALARGPFELEGSIFRGREPDEQRWDLMDPGALDSWSARLWYRPNPAWTLQVSHGYVNEPEGVPSSHTHRTTASASWTRRHGENWTSATVAYGFNEHHGTALNAVLAEATHARGRSTAYGRLEVLQVESDLLRFGFHVFPRSAPVRGHLPPGYVAPRDVLAALTVGAVRRLREWRGWDAGVGADVTGYAVPDLLRPYYGDRPVSFHAFVRLRPPAAMGRMVDMVMTRPMH